MRETLSISAKTRKLDVDNRLSLRIYYRTADTLLRQANVYRKENNLIDLYVLLLRFSSLVTETIPLHRDYRTFAGREKLDFRKRLLDIVSELELLKPDVQKQVDQLNKFKCRTSSSLYGTQVSGLTVNERLPVLKSFSYAGTNGMAYSQTTFLGKQDCDGNREIPEVPYLYSWEASSPLKGHANNIALDIPSPSSETLSKHSFLRSSSLRAGKDIAVQSGRVQYPSLIDVAPITIPSLDQNWCTPSTDFAIVKTNSALNFAEESTSLDVSVAHPSQDLLEFPKEVTLIRQPSPPTIPAPVQILPFSVEDLEHKCLETSNVVDLESQTSSQLQQDPLEAKQHTKPLHIATGLMDDFMRVAQSNTQSNLETCGVLAGYLKEGVFYVTSLIIPKQEGTANSCNTVNEEEIFEYQDKHELFQFGWIHTHPSQSCFMSSIDLHTHYSYQVMLQEAIAIVIAPTDSSRKYGIFRLVDPSGLKTIQHCEKRGFHAHDPPFDGGQIYEECAHVYLNPKLESHVVDLR